MGICQAGEEHASQWLLLRMMFPGYERPSILFGEGGVHVLRWAILFLIVAIIAGVFGFGGISAAATDIARLLFVVFMVLFVIALIAGRRITSPPL